MSGSVLTHRSNRASGLLPNNNVIVESVPVKGPQDGLPSNRRIINEEDDAATVKSNPNGSPTTSSTQSSSRRYVLPCFRIRRTKQTALVCLAMSAILLSITTSFMAYQSLSSLPSGNFLPPPQQWGAGRESRMQARKQRRASLSTAAAFDKDSGMEDDNSVKYSDYEAHLLNFIFNIRAEGVKFNLLSLREPDPPGQEMGFYTQLGCDVFNRLNSSNKGSNNNITATPAIPHKERIRKLWKSHLPAILEASRHPDDTDYNHRQYTEAILQSLSPYSLLDPSVSSSNPRRMMKADDIERILGILTRRLFGLFQTHDKNLPSNTTIPIPPPLRIAVFGGPTTEGKGCRRAKIEISPKSIMSNPAFCGFPYRLENFLNSFLLPAKVLKQLRLTLEKVGPVNINGGEFRLVEVINLAEEGTDSEYSSARVRNRAYPPLMKAQNGATGYGGGPPDVVIDAYGIDEYGKDIYEIHSTYDTLWQPSHANGKGCFKENQKPYPVIVRAVLEDRPSTNEGSPVTSSIMTAILGDAVDDVEEGEMSFPDYRDPDDKEIEAGGAFGMAGHIASSWAIAFNFASSALWHCASKRAYHPHPKAKRRMYNHAKCDNGIDSPCMFSFLAGSKGTTARPSAIASTLLPFTVENTGWQPGTDMDAGFARKGGLIGTGAGASMTLLFRNVTRPVRRLDVVSLRSTSHVWKEGVAKFVLVTGGDFSHGKEAAEASSKTTREVSFEITADLNAAVSDGEEQHISNHFGLDLDYADANESVGKDLLLRITLTKGTKFKILGLMLCE